MANFDADLSNVKIKKRFFLTFLFLALQTVEKAIFLLITTPQDLCLNEWFSTDFSDFSTKTTHPYPWYLNNNTLLSTLPGALYDGASDVRLIRPFAQTTVLVEFQGLTIFSTKTGVYCFHDFRASKLSFVT